MSSPEDNQLLNFIATTVETLRTRIDDISAQMATKVDLANLREQTREDLAKLGELTREDLANLQADMATREDLTALKNELRAEMASLRDEMATKDDLALVATTVRGDFEQVHFRFDALERVMTTRFGQVETDLSRIRSVLYLLAKDKPDILRLLGQAPPGEPRSLG